MSWWAMCNTDKSITIINQYTNYIQMQNTNTQEIPQHTNVKYVKLLYWNKGNGNHRRMSNIKKKKNIVLQARFVDPRQINDFSSSAIEIALFSFWIEKIKTHCTLLHLFSFQCWTFFYCFSFCVPFQSVFNQFNFCDLRNSLQCSQ